MGTQYVPSIAPAQYPAFLQISGGRLPKTLVEFQQNQDLNYRDERMGGHQIIPVRVEPLELQLYCQEMGCQPDGTALDHLAAKKGRKQDRGY